MFELLPPLSSPLACSILPKLALCIVPQACVAAFADAGGGRLRKVGAIFPEEDLSFPPALNVRNIPPFFSGLGVLDPFRLGSTTCGPMVAGGGESIAEAGCCGVDCDRGMSLLELFLEV